MKRSLSLLLLMLAGIGALATTGRAAQPDHVTIDVASPHASWRGDPMPLPGAVPGCARSDDPTCDVTTLTVDASPGTQIEVAIVADERTDDLALYVFQAGRRVAQSASGSADETVRFAHTGVSDYEIRVQPTIFGDAAGYAGTAELGTHIDDVDNDCSSLTPYYVPGLGTDDGADISLDVAVVADTTTGSGSNERTTTIPEQRAPELIQDIQAAYRPLDITVRLASLTKADIEDGTGDQLFAQTKALFGGRRPAGADVVVMMTLDSYDSSAVGTADCVGGVAFPDHAFVIANITTSDSRYPLSAVILAHEIGHLFGAHHHYSNCAEAITGILRLTPCTLMFPVAGFMPLKFGTMEGLFIREAASLYARP